MKHFEVVGAVILYDRKILCMQRGPGKNKETEYRFEFPGGKIEAGESMPDALMRELSEEMDLQVTIREEDYFMTSDYTYPDCSILLHTFLVHTKKPSFTRKEHISHIWMPPENLLVLDWAPADLPVAKALYEKGDTLFS